MAIHFLENDAQSCVSGTVSICQFDVKSTAEFENVVVKIIVTLL